MDHFIIGDIHGCFFTLSSLLQHWNREQEHLIFVGDLINKGLHGTKVVTCCRELMLRPYRFTVLKGNHEYQFAAYSEKGGQGGWLQQGGAATIEAFTAAGISIEDTASWFKTLPLCYESDHLLVSHGGVSNHIHTYEEDHEDSVVWNRKPLINVGKLQVHGHIPLKINRPHFDHNAHALNIDTGAAYGFGLTGVRVKDDGTIAQIFHMPTDSMDIP